MTTAIAERRKREKGSFLSHVATLVTGTAISQGITLLTILIVTRLFLPESFGLLALFMTIVSLLSVLGGGRYELAIMLPEEDREAANVLYAATLVLLFLCSLSVLGVAVVHHRLAALLEEPLVEPWLWAIPGALFFIAFGQVLGFWCGRMKRFRQVAVSRIVQSAGTLLVQVALYLLHANGGVALIGGWIFGQSMGTIVLFAQVVRQDGAFLAHSWQARSIPRILRTYRNFPLYKAPYSFVSNTSSQLVVVVLRVFSSLSTVGLFSMASRAIYLPVTLIASSMNQVFYEKAATETAPGRLESFVNRVLRIQVVLTTPLLLLAAIESRLLFTAFFGVRWAPSGAFAAFLAFAGYMYFLTSWLDRLFDVKSRQRLALGLELGGNLASLVALTLMLYFTKNALWAIAAFTVSEVTYSIVWLLFAYRVAGFRSAALRRLALDFVTTGLPVGAGLLAIHAFLHGWPALVLSCVLVLAIEAVIYFHYVRGELAYSSTEEKFRKFWQHKTSPLHGNESPEFHEGLAQELKELFPRETPARILEIGCGDGRLFPYLGFPASSYTGVDFSPKLLDLFRSHHPGLELRCSEGSSFLDCGAMYRLIFSHGVVQHFDPEMLDRHFENGRQMMDADSVLVCASVLDKDRQKQYDSGLLTRGTRARLVRRAKSAARRILGLDVMGYWYSREEIAKMAAAHGLEATFAESRMFSYRFHVILRLKPKVHASLGSGPKLFSRAGKPPVRLGVSQ